LGIFSRAVCLAPTYPCLRSLCSMAFSSLSMTLGRGVSNLSVVHGRHINMSKIKFKYVILLTNRRYKHMKPKEKSEEANPPALRKLFQDSAVAKVLDFLTLYKDFDYSKVEISRNSGVAWKTLYRVWPLIEKYDLVVETRRIGRAIMFKLNTENPVAKSMWEFAFQISKYDVDKAAKEDLKNTVKVPA